MKKKILVIDDREENIELLLELLSNRYDVLVSLEPQMGIELAIEKKPDLILLDVMMPIMDGYEVCTILKQKKITQHIPIIFLTAKDDDKSIEKAYFSGGVDYITKPFRPKELLARVKTHLKLDELLCSLEEKVENETQKRVAQEKIILHQNRLASIGEMMDAILHQWTQPLSVISSYNELLSFDLEKKKIDKEYIEKFQIKLRHQIQHMSLTLSEFRGFFRPSEHILNHDIKGMINKVLLLVEDEFHSKNIEVIINEEESFSLDVSENEFMHIILNIINNAKDAFIQNSINKRLITINILQSKEEKTIQIIDNAGGIKNALLEDIFKMNVTTKEKDKGTGIGLYISKEIAQKHSIDLSAKNLMQGMMFELKKSIGGSKQV